MPALPARRRSTSPMEMGRLVNSGRSWDVLHPIQNGLARLVNYESVKILGKTEKGGEDPNFFNAFFLSLRYPRFVFPAFLDGPFRAAALSHCLKQCGGFETRWVAWSSLTASPSWASGPESLSPPQSVATRLPTMHDAQRDARCAMQVTR